MKLVIDLEKITLKPVCSNGTYNEKTEKCDYTCNDTCKTYGEKPGTTCITYGEKNGTTCKKWGPEKCTCDVIKSCTFYSCTCNGNSLTKFKSGDPAKNNYESGCRSGGATPKCNSFTGQYDFCGYTSGKDNECKGNFVRNKSCTKDCVEYYKVKDYETCLEYNKVTDYSNCKEWNKKTCQANPGYDYKCPNGYENSNSKACKKVTAS